MSINDEICLDIETVCDVAGCPGHGGYKKCKHALSPWHSKITKIGVLSHERSIRRVFDSVPSFIDNFLNNPATSGCRFYFHNGKFDILHLRVRGCKIELDQFAHCTLLMAYVWTTKIPEGWLWGLKHKRKAAKVWQSHKIGKHALESLSAYFLGVDPSWKWSGDKDSDEYVMKDLEHTAQLRTFLEEQLKACGQWDFYLRLLSWTRMLIKVEETGIRIDLEALDAKEKELKEKEQELRAQLDVQWGSAHAHYVGTQRIICRQKYEKMAGAVDKPLEPGTRHYKLMLNALEKVPMQLDYDSPKQMTWLLRNYLGYDITSLEGDETTGKEVLERLAAEGKEDVALFLEWRKTQKLLTAFIPTYKELAVDGVLHPVFSPTGTRTGRLSSERPNLQQCPPELKKLFRPRAGKKFIGYDFSSIEPRLIALYSNDEALYELLSKGLSIHDDCVRIFFDIDTPHKEIAKLFPKQRKAAKRGDLSLFYGAGANRIRASLTECGFPTTESQAKEIHYKFKDRFRQYFEWFRECVAMYEAGEIVPNLLGRPIKIEDAKDAYLTGPNTTFQSSASDLNVEAAERVMKIAEERGYDLQLLALVHDFLIFESGENEVTQNDKLIVDSMTGFKLQCKHGPIKIEVEGGVMDQWS